MTIFLATIYWQEQGEGLRVEFLPNQLCKFKFAAGYIIHCICVFVLLYLHVCEGSWLEFLPNQLWKFRLAAGYYGRPRESDAARCCYRRVNENLSAQMEHSCEMSNLLHGANTQNHQKCLHFLFLTWGFLLNRLFLATVFSLVRSRHHSSALSFYRPKCC